MLLLTLAAAAAAPQPGALKTFADWTVGCDNVRRCQAVALVPGGEDRDAYLMLVVRRDATARALPALELSTERTPAGPLTLEVDGKPVGRVTRGTALPFNRALASALGQGRRATVTDARGRTLGSASLRGLAATFLHIDEQQRRLGTAGALIRRGPRPDAAVPAPPPLPRVVQPRPSPRPPRTISPELAARLIGPDNARCDGVRASVKPRAIRLDARASLVMVDHQCGNGAYNAFTSLFVVDEAGRSRPASLDAATGMDPDGANPNMLVNADWDATRRRVSSYAKGRGLGDCGTRQSFAWDGARFRLVEQAQMGECRGSVDYITTWRAAVTGGR